MTRSSFLRHLPSRKHSASHWRLQNIAQESVESSDDEFFDARDVMEGKTALLLEMSQWNSNDLVEQIETLGHLEHSRESLYRLRHPRCAPQSSVDGLEDMERKCRTQLLILVIHGGHILDSGGGDPAGKAGDAATLASVLERVARAHFQAAADSMLVRLVPCPPVCADAFSLVSNLNPYSYDETCVSSSVDHLPLASLPILAIATPRYQNAVAAVIAQANQVYQNFLQSAEGVGFTGQVCLVADCVGGVLCFDALCFSGDKQHRSPEGGSTNNSTESLKEKPGVVSSLSPTLRASKRLSKSNIDVSIPCDALSGVCHPLIRKQSDSCDADVASGQRDVFISSLLQDDQCGSRQALNPGCFEFEVSDCFLLGCPLGLVLAMRRTVLPAVDVAQLQPACSQIFNLFYPSDPSASRLEPLLHPILTQLPPFPVPRYQRYPLGDGRSNLMVDTVLSHFSDSSVSVDGPPEQCCGGSVSHRGSDRFVPLGPAHSGTEPVSISHICSRWWGLKRLDYVLFCPDVLTTFPTIALPHLFHASYWESTDAVAFILRQVMRCDCLKAGEGNCSDAIPISPSSPREKWLRRRTHVKLRNVTANHRVHDVIVTEDGPQTLVGRFMYGPLDMVTLTGEKVDVFLKTQPASGRWVLYDTVVTSSSGRVSYIIPDNKRIGVGVYPIKMVVKGDQTSAEAFLTVLPRGMECVVFSIDGSFAASVSLMGSDPKVRPGAVDVVRHWQDLGYLIIYITGRPDMQKQRVVSWLSQHNFPQGMVFFSEGLVHDPLRQKTIFLKSLVKECHIKISAAYGSMKDMSVYSTLGLAPNQIYIVGRPSKKHQHQCQFLSEGYAAHLSTLEFEHGSRSKKTRMVLRQGSFGLSSKTDFLSPSPDFLSCKRTPLLRRAMSVQQPSPPSSSVSTPKPERAQSQPESHKDGPEIRIQTDDQDEEEEEEEEEGRIQDVVL
ncbi:PITP-less RdgB-like protein isoform X1 [Onychostoma macrolepis]|uniref:PITP-less RdgB-like protein isoform X1 n=1 Tax=Onychostoma macrolepis TaxID=369639 RepID=UPI00272A7567|nr:PITP-less RdgB-like protein isoform X1 [Onychostoma macrolepis]